MRDAAVAVVGPQLVTLGGRGFGETKVVSEDLVWRGLTALGLLVSVAAGETHPVNAVPCLCICSPLRKRSSGFAGRIFALI